MNWISPLTRMATETRSVAATPRQAQPNNAATGSDENATSASGPETSLANKEVFLSLLVAQIKNQNPLNPADGTEFLSQLAQFSELEQLISIRENVESMVGNDATSTSAETASA